MATQQHTLPKSPIGKRFHTALQAIFKAGSYLRKEFGSATIEKSFLYDVKLEQDRNSEEILISALSSAFPEDEFLAEESGKSGKGEFLWIIDPLDGSYNYSRGIPHVCISVACALAGVVSFGIVYDFIRDEYFYAEAGHGAFLNGKAISTSPVSSFSNATGTFGFMKGEEVIRTGMELFIVMAPKLKKFRAFGAAALDISYVACGRTDLFVEYNLKPWDVDAAALILKEAGGELDIRMQNKIEVFVGTNGKISASTIYDSPRR
ncbi:MAG: inositol monophosphatase family protein [Candidatus Ratteibacteria bacterium]|jgi:myo-inositol-1(or 4)-monophosphatase